MFAGVEKTGVFAENFLQGITGHCTKSPVAEKNFPRRVRQHYAIGNGLQGAGLNTHLLFRPLPFLTFLGFAQRTAYGLSQPFEAVFKNKICSA
ncbi:MAG: hypothetical protein ABSC89_16230 [Verrucomicrobiota bacterium]